MHCRSNRTLIVECLEYRKMLSATTGDESAIQVIDNGDEGFITVGNWGQSSKGYQTDQLKSGKGVGHTATWTFSVTPGRYRISTTWAKGKLATDALYVIFDGNNIVGAPTLNQKKNPNDLTSGGGRWEDIGTYDIAGTSLVVRLSDNSKSSVSADAVRIQRLVDDTSAAVGDQDQVSPVGPTPVDPVAPSANVQIIDNGDNGFSTVGPWDQSKKGFEKDQLKNGSGSGNEIARWTFSVDPGQYQQPGTLGESWQRVPPIPSLTAMN